MVATSLLQVVKLPHFIVNGSGEYALKNSLSLYMQPCIYSPRSVFIPQWIKLIYATHNSLRAWLQLARLAAKNNDSRSG